MKARFRFCAVISTLIIIFLLIPPIDTSAYENNAPDYVSETEKKDFLEEMQFKLSNIPSAKHPIGCFAISDCGLIALAVNLSGTAEVLVYDSDGQYLYSYQFINNGCALTVFWEKDILKIIWEKDQYIGAFDSSGNCLQLQRMIGTVKTPGVYRASLFSQTEGTVGNLHFYTEMGYGIIPVFTRFEIENASGNRILIYDVAKEYNSKIIVLYILVLIWVVFIIHSKIKEHRPPPESEGRNC